MTGAEVDQNISRSEEIAWHRWLKDDLVNYGIISTDNLVHALVMSEVELRECYERAKVRSGLKPRLTQEGDLDIDVERLGRYFEYQIRAHRAAETQQCARLDAPRGRRGGALRMAP